MGLKPTVGLVSRAGIIPIAESQDTAGPMGRTVKDVAYLLGAIAGPDPDDPLTAESRTHAQSDYTSSLDASGLRGARIGVLRKLNGFGDKTIVLYEDALRAMKREGAILVDTVDPPAFGELDEPEMTVLLYEFRAGLNAYLAKLGGRLVKSLAEVIDFNVRNKAKELAYFGQDLLVKAEDKGPLSEKAYRDARDRRKRLRYREGIDAVMDKDKLEPSSHPPADPHG